MSARPKLPSLAEVIALAEQTGLDVSVVDLARMHKHSAFSEQVVSVLWPDARPLRKAAYMGLVRYPSVCGKHGATERFVSGQVCVLCSRECTARYKANNPEKWTAAHKRWRDANHDYLIVYWRARWQKRKGVAA